ncbi:SH3 domain-containing protein [Streptomyces sp. NPDC054933]
MTGHSARLFAAPSSSAPVVGVLYRGHQMITGGTRDGWVEVTDRTTGAHGWTAPGRLARPARLCLG